MSSSLASGPTPSSAYRSPSPSVTAIVPSGDALPEALAHDVGRGHGAGVVHARRAEQPNGAEVLPVDGDRRHDDGTRRERLEAVLGADGHGEPTVEDVAQQG